jgi:hypothetical protein
MFPWSSQRSWNGAHRLLLFCYASYVLPLVMAHVAFFFVRLPEPLTGPVSPS